MVLSYIAINVSIANAQAERTFTIVRANDPMLTTAHPGDYGSRHETLQSDYFFK